MRINQNVMANNASRNLSNTSVQLGKNLEKLSSGFRINRAADDAAGLVVSQGLRSQISGLKQAARNAQDGISVVQTAEGALNEVHTMLNRMRDLAVQAANTGANDNAARNAAQAEINALATEITRVSDSTRFGGMRLLNGTYGVTSAQVSGFDADNSYSTTAADAFTIDINGTGAVTVVMGTQAGVSGAAAATDLQSRIRAALSAGTAAQAAFASSVTVTSTTVGAGSSLTIGVSGLANTQTFVLAQTVNTPLTNLGLGTAVTAASGTQGTFQIGANASEIVNLAIGDLDATALGINALDVSTNTGAGNAITSLDNAIGNVSTIRGNLGALQNRFESMINNLQVTAENLSASESRIRDTDMAQEMVSFTKNNVLLQAGTAMLSQANQVPQSILSLLK